MKLLTSENIPSSVVRALSDGGYDPLRGVVPGDAGISL
jgi:hypothetical protein